nr:hypothetical protein [Mucilaginibacter sp. SP1R1]MBB6152704.1 hypothetical protein [Mucilaginibacter sp. SP1R1]
MSIKKIPYRFLMTLKKGIKEVVFGGDIGTKDANAWFFNTVKTYRFILLIVVYLDKTHENAPSGQLKKVPFAR